MRRRVIVGFAALAPLALAACDDAALDPREGFDIAARRPGALPASSADAAEAAPAAGQGPGPGSQRDREARALALLAGELRADGLEIMATDPGHSLDPDLYATLTTTPHLPVEVRFGAARTEGALDITALIHAVAPHGPELSRCYRRGLADQPGLAGTLTLRFSVDEVGVVHDAGAIGGGMPDFQVVRCSIGVLQRVRFPAAATDAILPIELSRPK